MESIIGKIKESLLPVNAVRENIISFMDSSEEFDKHWIVNEVEDIPITKTNEANKFLSPLFPFLEEKSKLDILDAGCGDGMHAFALELGGYFDEHKYVGLDISIEALRIAKGRLADKSHVFVQGDVGQLPFVDQSFDVVFSYGVLAYTESPEKSFKELLRVLKPGGLVGVWMYPKTRSLGFRLFSMVRKICKVTGKGGTNLIANCIVPFLGLLPTSSHLSLRNATWKQCREIVLVNIAPTHLQFFEFKEIQKWFNNEGIEITDEDYETPIAIWGRKSESSK